MFSLLDFVYFFCLRHSQSEFFNSFQLIMIGQSIFQCGNIMRMFQSFFGGLQRAAFFDDGKNRPNLPHIFGEKL